MTKWIHTAIDLEVSKFHVFKKKASQFGHVHFGTAEEAEKFLRDTKDKSFHGPGDDAVVFKKAKSTKRSHVKNPRVIYQQQKFNSSGSSLLSVCSSTHGTNKSDISLLDGSDPGVPGEASTDLLGKSGVPLSKKRTREQIEEKYDYGISDLGDTFILVLPMPGVLKKSDMKFSLHVDRLQLTVLGNRDIPNVGGRPVRALPGNLLEYLVVLPEQVVTQGLEAEIEGGMSIVKIKKAQAESIVPGQCQ